MKKIIPLVAISSFLFLLWCTKTPSISWTDSSPNTLENVKQKENKKETATQIYNNTADKFSLEFPATRTFEENVYWSSVMFFSPLSKNDKLRENVWIMKKTLDGEYTLDEYYTRMKPGLQTLIPHFVEISKETITINNIQAQKLIYKWIQGEVKLQRAQIYLIKNKIAYTITYTATEDTFHEFIQKIDEMVATFEIK